MGTSRGNKVVKSDITALLADCSTLTSNCYGYDKTGIASVKTSVNNSTLAIGSGIEKVCSTLQTVYNSFKNNILYDSSGNSTSLSAPSVSSVDTLILASDYSGLQSTTLDYLDICYSYTPCSCQTGYCSCDGLDTSCYLDNYSGNPSSCSPLTACTSNDVTSQSSYICDYFWCSAYYWSYGSGPSTTCYGVYLTTNCNPYGYYNICDCDSSYNECTVVWSC